MISKYIYGSRARISIGDVVRRFEYETNASENDTKYYYVITGFALNEETNERLVVYRALYGVHELFCTPVNSFFSRVDKKSHPDIKQKYKFERVTCIGDLMKVVNSGTNADFIQMGIAPNLATALSVEFMSGVSTKV